MSAWQVVPCWAGGIWTFVFKQISQWSTKPSHVFFLIRPILWSDDTYSVAGQWNVIVTENRKYWECICNIECIFSAYSKRLRMCWWQGNGWWQKHWWKLFVFWSAPHFRPTQSCRFDSGNLSHLCYQSNSWILFCSFCFCRQNMTGGELNSTHSLQFVQYSAETLLASVTLILVVNLNLHWVVPAEFGHWYAVIKLIMSTCDTKYLIDKLHLFQIHGFSVLYCSGLMHLHFKTTPLILHYTYAHTDIDMQTGWWVSAVVF